MITAILLFTTSKTPADPAISALITGVIGAAVTIMGAILRDRRLRLLKTGIKVEGTVFSIEYEPYSRGNGGQYYPVIRYVTNTGEWITKKHTLGSNPSAFTEGESVTVFYDPEKPSTFILNDKLSKIVPWGVLILGIVLIGGAIIRYITI
ncbi:DUF3592 domain-containing protein [Mucilaginibacter celer]|uniref:DUF3592 domain-containing protein n=1 Tax=Mucilaginibacter celer TaxID=2305508 RepID=A0A494VLM7_9SPHI|nr:DUF3592 domain-containing protein [Mucilaginibacter celer]AYL94999.1 DUF3592 domain-containing protein [Mucilaginibacter celer]